MSREIRTCRVCHQLDTGLYHYATRAYAHWACMVHREGAQWLRSLPAWKLRNAPVSLLDETGIDVARMLDDPDSIDWNAPAPLQASPAEEGAA